jgi:hypothetical protein
MRNHGKNRRPALSGGLKLLAVSYLTVFFFAASGDSGCLTAGSGVSSDAIGSDTDPCFSLTLSDGYYSRTNGPFSSTLQPNPTSITFAAKLNEGGEDLVPSSMNQNLLTVGGTCTQLPIVNSLYDSGDHPAFSTSDYVVLLTGGVCSAGQTLTLTYSGWQTSGTNPQTCASTNTLTFTISSAGESQCSTPTFAPGTGTIAAGTNVVMSDTQAGAQIYFTVDGTVPNSNTSNLYVAGTTGIPITQSETISAIAYLAGKCSVSDVATATYTVSALAPTVTLGTPSSATINSGQTATIAVTYANSPASTTLVSGSGTSASPPTGVTVTPSGTASCTTVALAGVGGSGSPSTSGAQISVSGCTGNGSLVVNLATGIVTNGTGSSAASSSQTITVANPPTVALGSPSNATINSSQTSTIAVTYGNTPTSTALVSGSGTSASAPTGLTVTHTAGASCTTVALAGPGGAGSPSTSGAQVSVSGCSGNGTVTVKVSAGAATNGGGSSVVSSGQTITVSNPVTLASGVASNHTGVGQITVGGGSADTTISATFTGGNGAIASSSLAGVTLNCDDTFQDAHDNTDGNGDLVGLTSPGLSGLTATWTLNTVDLSNALNDYNTCYLDVSGVTDTESTPVAVGSALATNAELTLVDGSGGGGGGGGITVSSQVTWEAGGGFAGPAVYSSGTNGGLTITFSAAVTQGQVDAVTLYCSTSAANALAQTGGSSISLGSAGSGTLSNSNMTVSWNSFAGSSLSGVFGDTCYLDINAITGESGSTVDASASFTVTP